MLGVTGCECQVCRPAQRQIMTTLPGRDLSSIATGTDLRYVFAMNLTFTSERLSFRPLADTDMDVAIAMLTDPAVMKYVGETRTKDQVIESSLTETKRCAGGCIGIWCVSDQMTDEKLGTGLFLPMPIDEDDTNWDLVVGDEIPDCEIEIGYILKRSAWGNGYATEISKRLLKFAFEETPLEEVVAVTDVDNIASQNVLDKSGFNREGVRRAYATQCEAFRITRRQWLKNNKKAL